MSSPSLQQAYSDLWRLNNVWIQIPGTSMVGVTWPETPPPPPGYDPMVHTLTKGTLGFKSRNFSGLGHGIPNSNFLDPNFGNHNIFYVEGAVSCEYTQCDAQGGFDILPCTDTSTQYDLEVYLENATMTPEGYIRGDDVHTMQILLGGSENGLYHYDSALYPRYIFANRKQNVTVDMGQPYGNNTDQKIFGMFSTPRANVTGKLDFGSGGSPENSWVYPDAHENAGAEYCSTVFVAYHQHGDRLPSPVVYWDFVKVSSQQQFGGFTAPPGTTGGPGTGPPVNPCDHGYHLYCWYQRVLSPEVGPQGQRKYDYVERCRCRTVECGGTRNFPRQEQPRNPTPPSGPGQEGPGGTSTTASLLSCYDCGPCPVTSKPYLTGRTNGSGVPSTINVCNTTMYPVSSLCTAVLMYINAPIKQEEYRVGQILFWAGIDDDGKIVSLSDPRYTDKTSDTVDSENIMSLPTSLQESKPGGPPPSSYNTYNIFPLHVFRNNNDTVNLQNEMKNPSGTHAEEMKMWYLKHRIGTIQFNPVTQAFQTVDMSSYQFTTLSRTLTAVNSDTGHELSGSAYSMWYCPSDGKKAYKPLELADGSQYIGWKNQGSGYTADSNVCYEVEWRTMSSTVTGYGDDSMVVIAGGLGKCPIYYTTTNTRPVTGKYITRNLGQGMIAMSRHIVRPRDRLPLAGGTHHLGHRDHQVRRFDVYNTQNNLLTGLDTGFIFDRKFGVASLTGRAFNITANSYPATTSASVTADRLFYEYANTVWNIADFNMFTGLSAKEFGLFLHITNNFSFASPLTSSDKMLNLIGMCTYNGKLTAANGAFYCAAVARSNPPTWCHVVAGIDTGSGSTAPSASNFVVCTTGCNLALPYITYRAV